MGTAASKERSNFKREYKEKASQRRHSKERLENRWKASMAGKPITADSPKKEEPKAKAAPPPPPPSNKERINELMNRGQP